jgi:hypothetical protein
MSDKDISHAARMLGRRGGLATTEAKVRAARENLEKARAVRAEAVKKTAADYAREAAEASGKQEPERKKDIGFGD